MTKNFLYHYFKISIILIPLILVINLTLDTYITLSSSAIFSPITQWIHAEENKVDTLKKELGPATTSTLKEFDVPPYLSDVGVQKMEEGIEKTLVSSEIPIVNTTIQFPNETRESQNTYLFDKISVNLSSVEQNNTINIGTVNDDSLSAAPQISTYSPNISTNISGKLYSFNTEPSIAVNNKTIFFTGNHFAAISRDGGPTWKYLNYKDSMPDDYCCDQDVIYDSNHKIFLWYRQGFHDCSGENRSVLGVSSDGITWQFRDIKPTHIDNKLKNSWFDYPQLALSNKFLYITTNINTLNIKYIKSCSEGQTDIKMKNKTIVDQMQPYNIKTYSTIIRIPLEELSKSLLNSSTSLEFDSYFKNNETAITFTPVQGVKT